MATAASRQELARRLGVNAAQLSVVDPALGTPVVPTAMAQAAATAAARPTAPYTLTVFTPTDVLPVISIEAAARDRDGAARLVRAAVALLDSQSSAGGGFASRIPSNGDELKRQAFVVEQVAPIRVKDMSTNSLPLKAIGGAVAFFALVASERLSPHAQDDERQARWWSVDELPPLAFDHSQMVAYALFRLRTKIEYSNVGFQLLPREFTLPALQRVYEAVLGNPIDKRNFRKKVLESGAVRPTGRTLLTGRSGVQPQLYEYTGQHFEFERPRRNGRVE